MTLRLRMAATAVVAVTAVVLAIAPVVYLAVRSDLRGEVDRVLLAVGAGGILAAALLGAVVARTALAPIARFTVRTELLAASGEATERLAVEGNDELGRLARSFNRTMNVYRRTSGRGSAAT